MVRAKLPLTKDFGKKKIQKQSIFSYRYLILNRNKDVISI